MYGTSRRYLEFTQDETRDKPESPRSVLEDRRNVYALRIHKGTSETILAHRYAREIFVYLELKPLFLSSVIFSQDGKYPYQKIAEFLGEGLSTIRRKISVLRKLKLVRFDQNKNIVLARYDRLLEVLKYEKNSIRISRTKSGKQIQVKTYKRKKYKVLNNGNTEHLVKQISIFENLNRQAYQVKRKIVLKELQGVIFDLGIDPTKLKNISLQDCERRVSKNLLRKYKRFLLRDYDSLLRKYERVYDHQVQQLAFKFPEINPRVTLSCQGIAKILNRKSSSSGYYQSRKMVSLGLMFSERNYIKIPDNSPAIWENRYGTRTDVFDYQYPERRSISGRSRKFFKNLPNTIRPNENAIFF